MDGYGGTLKQELAYLLAVEDGGVEIPSADAQYPVDILHRDRFIQSEFMPEFVQHFRGHGLKLRGLGHVYY
jgi:hypothetical protein